MEVGVGEALASEQSIRDQTNPDAQTFFETAFIRNEKPGEDPNVLFAEEYPGKWKGYIEWQNYPEKRAKAVEILARHKFPPPPEIQSVSFIHGFPFQRERERYLQCQGLVQFRIATQSWKA